MAEKKLTHYGNISLSSLEAGSKWQANKKNGEPLTLDIILKAMEQMKNAREHNVQDPEGEQPGVQG